MHLGGAAERGETRGGRLNSRAHCASLKPLIQAGPFFARRVAVFRLRPALRERKVA